MISGGEFRKADSMRTSRGRTFLRDLSSVTVGLLHPGKTFPHSLPGCRKVNPPADNVVARLKQKLDQARAIGFEVRMVVLGDEQPDWCQIGKSRVLFVNLSQTAAEQLVQVEETLADFAASAIRLQRVDDVSVVAEAA